MLYATKQRVTGFTLVELSIAIIVIGLLSAMILNLYTAYIKQKGLTDTKTSGEYLLKSLAAYVAENGRYPCPANGSAPSSSSAFGAEDCAATATTTGSDGASVLIGSIPFRALNIPAQKTIDGYGNRYTYAVTAALTTNSAGAGTISLVDGNGASVITPPGSARFALISHGETGLGANTFSGGKIDCAAGASTKDAENCNGDAVFMITDYSAGNNSNKFDDFVSYSFIDANTIDSEIGRYDLASITWMTHTQGDMPNTSVSTTHILYDTAFGCIAAKGRGEPTGLDYAGGPLGHGNTYSPAVSGTNGINLPTCKYDGAAPMPGGNSGRYKLSLFEAQAQGAASGNSTVPSTGPGAILIDTKFGCVIADYKDLENGPRDPQGVNPSPYLNGYPTCVY